LRLMTGLVPAEASRVLLVYLHAATVGRLRHRIVILVNFIHYCVVELWLVRAAGNSTVQTHAAAEPVASNRRL